MGAVGVSSLVLQGMGLQQWDGTTGEPGVEGSRTYHCERRGISGNPCGRVLCMALPRS